MARVTVFCGYCGRALELTIFDHHSTYMMELSARCVTCQSYVKRTISQEFLVRQPDLAEELLRDTWMTLLREFQADAAKRSIKRAVDALKAEMDRQEAMSRMFDPVDDSYPPDLEPEEIGQAIAQGVAIAQAVIANPSTRKTPASNGLSSIGTPISIGTAYDQTLLDRNA